MSLTTQLVRDGILAEICRHFDPCLDLAEPQLNNPMARRQVPEQVRTDRRALAALARTCRAFTDVALDALWGQLDSPEPFLCLLFREVRRVPADDPKLAEDTFEGMVLTSFNAGLPIQRARVAWYAQRVKSLRILKEDVIHPSMFLQPSMVRERDISTGLERPLLPSLEEIFCEPSPAMDEAITVFAGPNLMRVTFSLSYRQTKSKQELTGEDYALASIIHNLASSAPYVEELFVTHVPFPRTLLGIEGLRNIQVLDIHGTECTTDLLRKLSYLGRLNRLTLTASAGGTPLSSKAFCQLKHVRFIKGTFTGISRVLRSFGVCQLITLNVANAMAWSVRCLKEFTTSALALCLRSRCTLITLSIRAAAAQEHGEDPTNLPWLPLPELLQPFFFCAQMSTFELGIQSLVAISDNDLSLVGTRWPHLTRLDLVHTNAISPIPTFDGIIQLVEDCLGLRILQLPIVAAPTPSPVDWPVLRNGLEVLVIARQLYPEREVRVFIDDREIIAQIADRLFPELDVYESCEATKALEGGMHCEWRKIVDEVGYLRYLRWVEGRRALYLVRVNDPMPTGESAQSSPAQSFMVVKR
ncbi:uncharacterized protein B0H18DRAFT_1211800 [Fomitopsis serialis]|uniref:uncharacterized protein n=1 Tax=Fomitopsis serialis TaxID=139415 RepID=UPI0020075420|nr:uncharacterized protein B0H18DRAFT_1211800 [Neoantrodia serialis]KAH9924545.1 hypothetical protein B0H18DRAFT_1211800 [Neoantrodia serialis]